MLGIAALGLGTIAIGFVVGYCLGIDSKDKQIAKIKKETEKIRKLMEDLAKDD